MRVQRRIRAATVAASLALSSGLVGVGTASAARAHAASTINIGIIVPLTGDQASSFGGGQIGIEARIALQNSKGGIDGHQIKYFVADDQSSETGALTAAQLLVQQHHVIGIIEVSEELLGAESFLLQNRIPVIGPDAGPEFATKTYDNLFSSYGSFNTSYEAPTTFGKFFKSEGVTKFATVGINIAGAVGAVHEANLSVQHEGIPVVYSNTSSPVGETSFGAIALAIKASGANGLFLGMTANSNIALVTALNQLGYHIPVILGTGYGSDTLSSPPATQAMQGVYFLNWAEVESDSSPGTKAEHYALSHFEKFNLPPGAHVQMGYFGAEEFIEGLESAHSYTSLGVLRSLRKLDTTANGLFGTHKLNFSAYGNVAQGTGPGNCLWITHLEGKNFQVVKNANPVCGTILPGTGISS